MTYLQLAYLHLATILPAFAIGTWLLVNRKGAARHKRLGRAYMALMLATALISLFMPAEVGPQLLGHFGFIHGFSLLTLVLVPSAFLAARQGRLQLHRGNMIGLYVGGILLAGAFAFAPGRLLHQWLRAFCCGE
jgi:uncharacterized membrane protein